MTTPPITCPADLKSQLRAEALARFGSAGNREYRLRFDAVFDEFWEKVEQHFAQPIATAGDEKGGRSMWCLSAAHERCNDAKCDCDCHKTSDGVNYAFGLHREPAENGDIALVSSPSPASGEREEIQRPALLTSCAICAEDYSWPLDEVFWYPKTRQWICNECHDSDQHGESAASAKELIESDHQLSRAQDKARIAGLLEFVEAIKRHVPSNCMITHAAIAAELNRNTEKQ